MRNRHRRITLLVAFALCTLALPGGLAGAPAALAQPPTVLTTSGPCDVNGDGNVDALDHTAIPANFLDQGNVCQELNALGGFNVTLVTPAQFAAMTTAQIAAFDCIALDTKQINAVGLGTAWHGAVGVLSGGPVFLTNHDALWHAWFNRVLAPLAALPSDRLGAETFIRDAVTWACTDTGLVIFNGDPQFRPTGFGFDDSLPAARGIVDDFVPAIFQAVGTSILPAFAAHPVYANVNDIQDPPCGGGFVPAPSANPFSIATFPSFGYFGCGPVYSDGSYSFLFRGWNAGIFATTETAFLKTLGPGDPFPDVFPSDGALIDGHPISLIRPGVKFEDGRFTGGGSVFTGGARYTHGFELHCAASLPNNLQINWGGNRFHLTTLATSACIDNPALSEGMPVAGFDTFMGSGAGLFNGVPGATITFEFTDDGEPGKGADLASFTITPPVGPPVVVAGLLDKGNHQAHSS